jgi:ribonuclease BN (tRNA processing enzyme)
MYNKNMRRDIIFDVLGNTSAFSLMGESSGYMITVNNHSYLLECGSPIFPLLGYKGIAGIKGIFCSHSHEDHKRWFTDAVLFTFYNPLLKHRLRLISSEVILEEFAKNSKGALERSLSDDSKRVVDIPYGNMVEDRIIGPKKRYFINLAGSNDGTFQYRVEDRDGNIIGPEKAKIFINPAANRPRLLFRDDESGEWVEPESYYPFSSTIFYENDQNIFHDKEAGLTVTAINSSVWHGVPTIAFKFTAGKNSILFSADTVWKPSLWKELCETYRPQRFDSISRETFEKGSIIYGDINDFIERTWSRERFESAMAAYDNSVLIIHDVARKKSIVHTDYQDIANAPFDNIFYTHNPDNLTALRPILVSGKRIVIKEGKIYESVKGRLFPFNANVYVHHFSCDLVGYSSENGAFKVIEKDGLLGVAGIEDPGKEIMRVDLYQDIRGEYFPILLEPDRCYRPRPDGRIEEVIINKRSTRGKVVKSLRKRIR